MAAAVLVDGGANVHRTTRQAPLQVPGNMVKLMNQLALR
jgi:hypothetical protein